MKRSLIVIQGTENTCEFFSKKRERPEFEPYDWSDAELVAEIIQKGVGKYETHSADSKLSSYTIHNTTGTYFVFRNLNDSIYGEHEPISIEMKETGGTSVKRFYDVTRFTTFHSKEQSEEIENKILMYSAIFHLSPSVVELMKYIAQAVIFQNIEDSHLIIGPYWKFSIRKCRNDNIALSFETTPHFDNTNRYSIFFGAQDIKELFAKIHDRQYLKMIGLTDEECDALKKVPVVSNGLEIDVGLAKLSFYMGEHNIWFVERKPLRCIDHPAYPFHLSYDGNDVILSATKYSGDYEFERFFNAVTQLLDIPYERKGLLMVTLTRQVVHSLTASAHASTQFDNITFSAEKDFPKVMLNLKIHPDIYRA